MVLTNLLGLVSRLLLQKDSLPASSPISAMPPEILSQIFVELIAQIPLREWQTTLTTLCLVCHAWKITAYNEPRLWTALFLGLKSTSDGTNALPSLVPFVTHTFGRAGALPLHLAIANLNVGLGDILDTLSPRISSLDLRKVSLKYENSLNDWDWGRLSTLKLHLPRGCTQSFTAESLPRLVNLDLDTPNIEDWFKIFPWGQLIRLRIKSSSKNDSRVSALLQKCINLEECSAYFSLLRANQTRPISLPKLRSLTLQPTRIDPDYCFFQTPALESLKITIPEFPSLLAALESLTIPCSSTLRTLHLCGTNLSKTEYIDLLHPLHALRTLSICTSDNCCNFFILRGGTFHDPFLPNLRALTLRIGCAYGENMEHILSQFVDGGTSGNTAGLESFSLSFYRFEQPDCPDREFLPAVRAYGRLS